MSLYQSLAVVPGQNGKAFASGTVTPASADVEVTTGLGSVDHCGVSLFTAPIITHTFAVAQKGTVAGDIRIRSYKPTDTTLTTLVAATGTLRTVAWWAVGDL